MPDPNELKELKAQIAALQQQLDGITKKEWRAYIRVRDILRVARTIAVEPTVPEAAAKGAAAKAAADKGVAVKEPVVKKAPADGTPSTGDGDGGYYITHPASHACAMLGIFEPGQGEVTSTEYDAAAVERFAALGG